MNNNNKDESNGLSRMELRKKSRGHKLIAIILVTIVVVIGLFTLVFGMMSNPSDTGQSQSSSSSSSMIKSKGKKASSKKDKAIKKSTSNSNKVDQSSSSNTENASHEDDKKASNSSSSKTSSVSSSSNKPANNNSSASSSSSVSNQSSDNSNDRDYAVVGQNGENDLYRIAKNSGLTVDQLKQLNGLTSDNVSVNQKIRVK
ncbi:LysM peptidoglycan-binding domain-containing protein [Apilactobacillus timberlakei]|uniref:LysM peptidoglycan-binding domain-containing protein n=1 Tax=Apilactobacillus timberlakei TaxID=2008380 RepID=UPI0015E84B1B|nr:LysM peptidoglycan-binding domain-containing protein [Apilactobacillus timberlakei]